VNEGAGERRLQDKFFLVLLAIVTIAFAALLRPFFGAILWAVVIAILFAPLQRRLVARFNGRSSWAALATLLAVLLILVLPLAALGAALVQEATGLYARMKSGEIDFGRYFQQVFDVLPAWATSVLDRYGLVDLKAIQERLSSSMMEASQFLASRALTLGQGTLDFVVDFFLMLYLLFFLLRDGEALMQRLRAALPVRADEREELIARSGVVIRATIKGNLVVALIQGALGGLIFWILGIHGVVLWAVVMAVLSLLPAVGTALVWGPVAIWLFATGQVMQGAVLVAFGVLVIGLVDNVMRPLLVGKDTKMPDYIVLFSTLGGIALFGINGFVIGPVIAALFMAAWETFSRPVEEAPVGPGP
jgi:predicted PurR-regulated permease PerM